MSSPNQAHKPYHCYFVALLRVTSEADLLKMATALGKGETVVSGLEAVATNAWSKPDESGYELTLASVSHHDQDRYVLCVHANVMDENALKEAAFAAYEKSCGRDMDDDFEGSYDVTGMLFEVVLGSNASRSGDCGFEIVNWGQTLPQLFA